MLWTVLVLIIIVYYLLDWILRSLKVSNFTDKYVFITGCDSGFGKDLAIRLDSLGFHVFAGCLSQDGAKSLSESCSSRLVTVLVDVSKTESIESALRDIQEKLPSGKGLWALVNNAGITGVLGKSEMTTREDYLAVLNVNILGMADMTKHFLPLIRKTKGRIVNTSSILGRFGFLAPQYTISKFGVEGYSDILRREVSPQGIRVSIVEPGFFKTPILNLTKLDNYVKQPYERSSSEVQKVYGTDFVTKSMQAYREFNKKACTKTSLVVDAYTHALTSRYPRTRYVVGTDAKLIYLPLSYLPDWLSDAILARLNK